MMAALTVFISTDFSAQTLDGIDAIDFTNESAATTTTFANMQFDNAAILDNVLMDEHRTAEPCHRQRRLVERIGLDLRQLDRRR